MSIGTIHMLKHTRRRLYMTEGLEEGEGKAKGKRRTQT